MRNQQCEESLLPVNSCIGAYTHVPPPPPPPSASEGAKARFLFAGKSPFSSSAKKLGAINKTFSFFHWIKLCVCAVAPWLYITTASGSGCRSAGEPGMLASDLWAGTTLLPKEHKWVISTEDLMITAKHQLNSLVQREIRRERDRRERRSRIAP